VNKTTRSRKEIQKIINTLKKLPLSQLKVLTFLSFRGTSWPKEINDEIDVPVGTIRPALRQLRSKGYLTQALNGIYKSNICFIDIIISELIHTHEEFESRVSASVSKIIQAHEEESESRVPTPDSIIIPMPEKSIIAIKNLKDVGYPPREIKRIMKAKGKNVNTNALIELLKVEVNLS